MRYKKTLPILLAVLVATALAVPVIQLTVQQLGVGYKNVLSPCSKAWVDHVFTITPSGIKLDKVRLKFDADLPAGTYIRVELRDNSDNVLSSGEMTLASDLPAGNTIVIDLNPDLDIYGIRHYKRIVVLVAGEEVTT